jgi:hypothetical protein
MAEAIPMTTLREVRAKSGRSVPSLVSRVGSNGAVALALFLTAATTHAAVYKCTDAAGKTTYSDLPCDSSSKPLALPDSTKGRKTDPHMCEQLRDELNRLAAEADRNAKRGHSESAAGANRRKSLTRQYEDRCVAISRSR